MMDKVSLSLIRLAILFTRNVEGCFNAPYVTYRRLSQDNTDVRQTIFVPLLVILYFIFVALIRAGLQNQFLLTAQFNRLFFISFFSFLGVVLLLYLLGKAFGGKGTLKQIYTLWSFTLIPTLTWFFITSILYLLLPPPRTLSLLGKLYSVVFIAFSIAVLSWKIILYYLTLRFALKLDLLRISIISAIALPILVIYAVSMYRLGIFRIPFL